MTEPLTEEQTEILYNELGIDAGDLTLCNFSKVNTFGMGWTDGDYLIFNCEEVKGCDRRLYYLGAEGEAVLVYFSAANSLAVFSDVDTERIDRVKVEV